MAPLPTINSVLAPEALAELAAADYGLTAPRCRLWARGANDTYLLECREGTFALRAYRASWRNEYQVRWELDLLDHLELLGAPVAGPLRRRDSAFYIMVRAPEGLRAVALFSLAAGAALPGHDDAHARRCGGALALIHEGATAFAAPHNRFALRTEHLLDEPIATLIPLLEHRPTDLSYLEGLAARLRSRILLLADELTPGICHGDFHPNNCHVDGAGKLTVFDFDCAGPGWVAYDLATFRWSLLGHNRAEAAWEGFLAGYREVRPFVGTDLAAVPFFEAARAFWLMGLHGANAPEWGAGWINDAYFDRHLLMLRNWEREHLQ